MGSPSLILEYVYSACKTLFLVHFLKNDIKGWNSQTSFSRRGRKIKRACALESEWASNLSPLKRGLKLFHFSEPPFLHPFLSQKGLYLLENLKIVRVPGT